MLVYQHVRRSKGVGACPLGTLHPSAAEPRGLGPISPRPELQDLLPL